MKRAILFDFGNTLVSYYHTGEFPPILKAAIREVRGYLEYEGFPKVPDDLLDARVQQENFESSDSRVRPLEERLARIFEILISCLSPKQIDNMCRRFLIPIFKIARCYEDSLEALDILRDRGYKIGVVSNTPWGSPAEPWREEVNRHGVAERVDSIVFCRDVGWRKPSEIIFKFSLNQLGVREEKCIFVGDSMKNDINGARACGVEAILIDRRNREDNSDESPVKNMSELLQRLEKLR